MEKNQNDFELSELEPRKKERKFGTGLAVGIIAGILATGIGTSLAVNLYTKATDNYLILGPKNVHTASKNDVLDAKTEKKIEELLSYVDLYYNDTYKEDDIRDAIYKGTMSGLKDPYSVYYTKDEYKSLNEQTSGAYYGIGVLLSQNPDTMKVTVSKVFGKTPAEEAGLRAEDQIVKVEDCDSSSVQLSELVKKIRGEEGTKVHLKIYRPSTKETLEVDVERKNVNIPSVEARMLSDGIGYIQISEFQNNTASQFKKEMEKLKQQDMKGLIVDVRGNPGGLVSSVTEILDEILPEGTTVYTEDKYGRRKTYQSDSSCEKYPMAVLVDKNSASASEIFAGAIKDYNYGTLIGTKTFGKGIVQSVFPLKDGTAIKLTTAKYYTPKGNYIHGVGIEPDIKLEYNYSGPKDEDYDMKYDNQLQKAIQVVKDKL